MTIRKKGYYRWEGKLKTAGFNWWPILMRGIRSALKKKNAKALFGFAALPFFVFLSAIYISTKPELKMLTRLVNLLNDDAVFFNVFFTNDFSLFYVVLLSVFIGSELISADLKFNALPLYFSRPLDKKDYIAGKFSIILFYLLAFTLLPGILLVLFKIIFTGSLTLKFHILIAVLLFPFLVSFFFASLTLVISAFSSNRKFVWISIFLIYIFSNALAEILNGIFKNSAFLFFSIETNIKQAGSFFFQTKSSQNIPTWISFVIIVVFSVLMVFILSKRIAKSEAQIETSG